MAVRISVPGSGYGSVYVDSLIWGGIAWDPQEPIKVYFGRSADFDAAYALHESSDYQILWSASAVKPWTTNEIRVFTSALSAFSKVCGLTFATAASVEEADMVWWKARLDDGVLGAHEPPAQGPVWGYFDPSNAGWRQLKAGGDGLNTIMHELGHGLGLAHPHDGGDASDATRFPGARSQDSVGSYGLNQGVWTVMSYNTGWDKAEYDLSYGARRGSALSTSPRSRRSMART